MNEPRISVVLCTHNRVACLRETLTSLTRQTLREWELLLVDNGSQDGTRAAADEYRDRLEVRYFHEPRLGKSFALNHGVRQAASPLVAFTDDDVTPDPDWLQALVTAAAQHPDVSCFGGKIHPLWLAPPPAWILTHAPNLIRGAMVFFDIGNEERNCADGFWGANLAIRRSVFDTFAFREDLGPNPYNSIRGEETDLQRRLTTAGHLSRYVPRAVVHHRNPPDRLTERYIRDWYRGEGASAVRVGRVPRGPRLAKVPLQLYWQVAKHGLRYGCTRCFGPSKTWLRSEIRFAQAIGAIQELRHTANGNPPPS